MSIKFVCGCGKRLRAHDSMAGRRIRCPRCGCPAGVPSLQPTHRGTAASPMTPAERCRQARQRSGAPVAEEGVPATTAADDLPAPGLASPDPTELVSLRHAPPRPRPTPWHGGLAQLGRAWQLVLGLGLAWGLWSGCGFALFLELRRSLEVTRLTVLAASWLGVALVLGAVTSGFLERTLLVAARGDELRGIGRRRELLLLLLSPVRWLLALLAGPAALAVAGCFYWLHGGDLTFLDWLVLADLGVVAVAWWVFAVAASADSGRLRDVHVVAAARLAYRVGFGGLVVLGAAGLLVVEGGFVVRVLVRGPDVAPAVGLLVGCAVGNLFLATVLFRLLGTWCQRSRPPAVPEPAAPAALPHLAPSP
jgi:hypothetical protein